MGGPPPRFHPHRPCGLREYTEGPGGPPGSTGSERCAGPGRRFPPDCSDRRPHGAGAPLRCTFPSGVPPVRDSVPLRRTLALVAPLRTTIHREVAVLMV